MSWLSAASRSTMLRRKILNWKKKFECRRVLLGAGADPTIIEHGGDGFLLYSPRWCHLRRHLGKLSRNSIYHYSRLQESIQVLQDFRTPFINLGLGRGETPLTRLAMGFRKGLKVAKIRGLLDRGVSINQRNNFDQNCLHVAMKYARAGNLEELESFVFFIRRGANIDAIDKTGMSASYYAYQPQYTIFWITM